MRFETEPGYQAQVDFGQFQVARADGSVTKLFLFSMILGYSRKVYVELIEHCDLPSFLDWQGVSGRIDVHCKDTDAVM